MNDQVIDRPTSLAQRVIDWMDERYELRSLLDAMLHVYVPREAKTFYLGGITLFLFFMQASSGILLTLYYQPTPDTAYNSVLFITSDVSFGWLIRSVHAWGANLMIVACVLHLLRVFFQGAYKRPREITWVLGVFLLFITLGFGFTGYLLPWDQRAFWATTVGTESAGAVPVIGDFLLNFIRGGATVSDVTLTRFFGIHTLVLPVSLAAVLLVHIVLIHQHGLANPKKPAGQVKPDEEPGIPFFPHYILDEAIAWYIVLAVLVILASLFPAGLEAKANPLETPAHIKPEWYFLSLYQFLKLVPRTVGVLTPVAAAPLLILLPFLDRNPEVAPAKRPRMIAAGVLLLLAITILTVWGHFS